MARLNEAPAAPDAVASQQGMESVDALKRRFIRQNRELAKNNSNQSLRIRSLELEVSRLLVDNLELRNQALQLQNEVYTAQSRASVAAAKRVKHDLVAKIAELSEIVCGIEDAGEPIVPPGDARGVKRPILGNWRERQSLTDLRRDCQMPTIVEDKLYPRRTLSADEIQAIRLSDHSSNDSPDLGPPPVAHFDYEEPLKNASPLVSKMSPDEATSAEQAFIPANLSMNLETRRKRRDSQSKPDIRRRTLLPQSPAKAEGEVSSILRTGAKRKLADRDGDKPIVPLSRGEFTFSRRAITETGTTSRASVPIKTNEATSEDQREIQALHDPAPARKVLGDKSVNMSPKKAAPQSDKPGKDSVTKPLASALTNGRESAIATRRRVCIPVPTIQDEAVEIVHAPLPPALTTAEPELLELPAAEPPPLTPATLDLFSPTPSEPSAKATQGRGDTPPPTDLSSLNITSETGVRPSRRARAAVNYAEPSLNAKMRRPDEKMVDAISGLQAPRRAVTSSVEKKALLSSSEGECIALNRIKLEPRDDEGDEAWKHLPPAKTHGNPVEPSSPLSQKGIAPVSEQPEPTIHDSTGVRPDEKPSASSTISALIAVGNSQKKRRESSTTQQPLGTDIQTSIDSTTKKLEELDLYEFKDSSSPLTDGIEGTVGNREKVERVVRKTSHRRHSSLPKDVRPRPSSGVFGDAGGSGEARERAGQRGGEAAMAGRADRTGNRRRSMMV